jgi:hypothetical protein
MFKQYTFIKKPYTMFTEGQPILPRLASTATSAGQKSELKPISFIASSKNRWAKENESIILPLASIPHG